VIRYSGTAVGAEGVVLARQIARFEARHPGLAVDVVSTPDAADQRHQLYVQWLGAASATPDVLQLDVVWTPELAAAGWLLPLDDRGGAEAAFVRAAIAADRWAGRLHAASTFVAGFVGSPAMNLLPCAVADGVARAGELAIAMPALDGAAMLGIRPPDIELVAVAAGRGDANGRLEVIEALGRDLLCHIELGAATADLRVLTPADAELREGDLVGVAFRRERLHVFDSDGRRVTPPAALEVSLGDARRSSRALESSRVARRGVAHAAPGVGSRLTIGRP